MLDAATLPAPARPDERLDFSELSELARQARTEEPVTYTAVLPLPRRVVQRVTDLLEAHFASLLTRPGRRALTSWDQAVAFLRVMLHDVEPDQTALDCAIGRSTAHRLMAEAEDVVAAQAPSLSGALVAARAAGHRHLNLDGTLIQTDRVSIPGPTTRKNTTRSGPQRTKVDLWWSGRHKCQSITWRQHPGGHRCRWLAPVGQRRASRT